MRFCILLLTFIQFSCLAAVLVVPDNFRVLKVNNIEVKQSFFVNETTLKFKPGQHSITLQYSDMFESSFSDDHSKVLSEPFDVSFILTEEKQLRFKAPELLDLDNAKQYAKAPSIKILNEFGNALDLFHSMDNETVVVNNTNSVNQAPVPSDKIKPTQNNTLNTNRQRAVMTSNNTANSAAPDAIAMLKFWWASANEQQRQQFKQYLAKSENDEH